MKHGLSSTGLVHREHPLTQRFPLLILHICRNNLCKYKNATTEFSLHVVAERRNQLVKRRLWQGVRRMRAVMTTLSHQIFFVLIQKDRLAHLWCRDVPRYRIVVLTLDAVLMLPPDSKCKRGAAEENPRDQIQEHCAQNRFYCD